MGNPISVLYGEPEPAGAAVALEMQQTPQRVGVGEDHDVESPRTGTDTPAGKALALVAQLTTNDATETNVAQLAALSALLAAEGADDATVDEIICTALTRQCTIPPSTSTLKALAVFSYLLKRAQETTATNEYDFSDVMIDDPDTLPMLRCYVPYDEPAPQDRAGVQLFEAALEVMLLCTAQSTTIPVAYAGQQKIPMRAGDMVAWSLCESSGRTLDMSINMIFHAEQSAAGEGKGEKSGLRDNQATAEGGGGEDEEEEEVDVVKEKSRCVVNMGTYTTWQDGELVITFDNTFSWLRHKEVSLYIYTQDEYDYDDGLDSDEPFDDGLEPEPEPEPQPPPRPPQGGQSASGPSVRIAAGSLRAAIMRRDLGACRKIISTPMLANLAFEPKKGFVLLHIAAFENAVQFAELLLKRGAVVDVRSSQGVTPLFAAAAHGHLAMVQLLAEAGGQIDCSLRSVQPDGNVAMVKPIDVATQKGHQEVLQYLQSRGSVLTTPASPGTTLPPPTLVGMSIAEAQKQAAEATAALQKPAPSLDPVAEADGSEDEEGTEADATDATDPGVSI